MRVGRRQASYKGSPDSKRCQGFFVSAVFLTSPHLTSPHLISTHPLSQITYPFCAPLAPISYLDASARDIKSVRLTASVREGV